MAIETLGEALFARLARHRPLRRWPLRGAALAVESPNAITARSSTLGTLVWTRGRAFPLSRLSSGLRRPRCGSRYVVALYELLRRAAVR